MPYTQKKLLQKFRIGENLSVKGVMKNAVKRDADIADKRRESLFLGFLKEDLFYFFQINFQDFYFSLFLFTENYPSVDHRTGRKLPSGQHRLHFS